jgi:hypothetical protein
MSTQYRLVQSGKTASGGCSAGPRFVRACSATDLFLFIYLWTALYYGSESILIFNTLENYAICVDSNCAGSGRTSLCSEIQKKKKL